MAHSDSSRATLISSYSNMHSSYLNSIELYVIGGVPGIREFVDTCKYLEKIIDTQMDMADIDQAIIDNLEELLQADTKLTAANINTYMNLLARFTNYAKEQGCKVQILEFPVQSDES